MPTARELLDQADALMRRNRTAAFDDIPVLTDAVPSAEAPLVGRHGVQVHDLAQVGPADPIPTLTDRVAPSGAVNADLVIVEGEPSDWLDFDEIQPSIIGEAPDSIAIVPPVEVAQDLDEALLESAEHEEIELTSPAEEEFDEEFAVPAEEPTIAPALLETPPVPVTEMVPSAAALAAAMAAAIPSYALLARTPAGTTPATPPLTAEVARVSGGPSHAEPAAATTAEAAHEPQTAPTLESVPGPEPETSSMPEAALEEFVAEPDVILEAESPPVPEAMVEAEEVSVPEMRPEAESEAAGEAMPEAESVAESEAGPETESVAESEAGPETESVAESDARPETESVAELDAMSEAESEVAPAAKPEAEGEAKPGAESAAEPDPMLEAESATELAPIFEAKSVAERDSIVEADSVVAVEPMVEAEAVAKLDPAVEAELVSELDAMLESESVTMPEAVSESDAMLDAGALPVPEAGGAELGSMAEAALEPEATLEPETAVVHKAIVEPETASVTESTRAPEPARLEQEPGEVATASTSPWDDQARWDVVAEEIRMQVLQRIDLFTDTGLREQLGLRLKPIVDRASADLVATINQHVGELLRSYVAEAIEREIERWREEH